MEGEIGSSGGRCTTIYCCLDVLSSQTGGRPLQRCWSNDCGRLSRQRQSFTLPPVGK